MLVKIAIIFLAVMVALAQVEERALWSRLGL